MGKLSNEEVIMGFIKEIRMFIHNQRVEEYGLFLYAEIAQRTVFIEMFKTYQILYGDVIVTKYVDAVERVFYNGLIKSRIFDVGE
jgi:hypothetical protein